MKNEILTACDQLVSAMVNGVCQGIILAILVALGLRMLRRTNAATRHAVWFCTLLLLVSLLVANLLRDRAFAQPPSKVDNIADIPTLESDFVPTAVVSATISKNDEPDSLASTDGGFDQNLTTCQEKPLQEEPSLGALPLPLTEAMASEAMHSLSREKSSSASIGQPKASLQFAGSDGFREATTFRWLAERLMNPLSWKLPLRSKVPKVASMMLLAFWLMIAGVRVSVLLWRLSGIRALKQGSFQPSMELRAIFKNLRARLAVNRKVELRVSPRLRSPVLLGFIHPTILLPAEQTRESEQILHHELAHVRRRDDWANLVQHVIHAVFFFHPAIWWISKRLTLEREIACDDHVLQQCGQPRAYALLLANLAGRMQGSLPLLAPGASTNKSQLKQRIDMILDTNRNTSPRLAKMRLGFLTSVAALVAFATIYAAPRVILAQNEAPHAPAPAAGAPTAAPDGDQVPVLGDIPLLGRLFRSEAASAKKKDVLIAVAALPEIPDPDTSEAALPGTPAPKAVGPGPKFKPGSPKPPLAVPAPAIPSTPSVTPGIPAPPTPMIATVQPAPFASPRTPRPPRARPGDSSLEERLDRLEHMVESLIAERGERPGQPKFPDGMINPKEIEKMKEYAKRETARAAEEAKRATREAERVWKAEPRRQFHAKFKEESQKQLEAMRKQLENLEREKERLSQQIERLEHERQQLDEQEGEDQPGREIEKEK